MHVARNKRTYVAKSGERRVYESVLVRRTYRDGGKVRHETLANLSALPAEAAAAVEATLKGERLVPAGQAVTITRSVPHGHVAAVAAMAVKLGLPGLLGPAGPARDLALALVISRVVRPASKLSTLAWWADTTLGADLGVDGASTDDIYAAMDWLASRQDGIEAALARRHLAPDANPAPDGPVRPVQLLARRLAVPAGRPRLLPGRQERKTADRVRAAHRPRGPPGRGPGVPRQHRRPCRVHPGRPGRPGQIPAAGHGHGRRPGHDHLRPDRRAEPDRGRHPPARPLRVDHRAARPGHQEADGRGRPAAAVPVRPAGPGRDHQPGLPRRAVDRLPQPGPGRRARPQTRGPAGRHREAAGPDHRPRQPPGGWPAPRRSASRRAR